MYTSIHNTHLSTPSPYHNNNNQEGYEMWPTTCQREGVPALDPDYPYHAGSAAGDGGGGYGALAPVDERQDLLLLERIWRWVGRDGCGLGWVGRWRYKPKPSRNEPQTPNH